MQWCWLGLLLLLQILGSAVPVRLRLLRGRDRPPLVQWCWVLLLLLVRVPGPLVRLLRARAGPPLVQWDLLALDLLKMLLGSGRGPNPGAVHLLLLWQLWQHPSLLRKVQRWVLQVQRWLLPPRHGVEAHLLRQAMWCLVYPALLARAAAA